MSSRPTSIAPALALVIIGCQGPGPVDFEIAWRFGTGDCDTAAVNRVEAALYEHGRSAAVARAEAPCGAHALTVEAVPPGRYALTLTGFSAAGCATHGARLGTVDVEDALAAPVLLGVRSRPLDLRWTFGDGMDCAALSVSQIEAIVQVGDAPPARGAWLCASGHGVLPEVLAGPAHVTLLGLDAAGTTVARNTTDLTEADLLPDPCADDFVASLRLEGCATAGCP